MQFHNISKEDFWNDLTNRKLAGMNGTILKKINISVLVNTALVSVLSEHILYLLNSTNAISVSLNEYAMKKILAQALFYGAATEN